MAPNCAHLCFDLMKDYLPHLLESTPMPLNAYVTCSIFFYIRQSGFMTKQTIYFIEGGRYFFVLSSNPGP